MSSLSSIVWQTDIQEALDSAQSTQQPILLEFYHPESIGCQQMKDITYANRDVITFIDSYLIPLRFDTTEVPANPDYHHIWTPTLVVLNPQGRELQRTIGFLNPEDFLAVMHIGMAKVRLDTGAHDTAIIPLQSVMETFINNNYVPEAIYLCGVVRYQMTSDPSHLKEAYKQLKREYPDHIWTKRADPFRLL